MQWEIFWRLFAFVFGLLIGSFLNVCIYRIPRKKSIVLPASFCPHCQEPIKWYDNIPLLSYLFLQGKCRRCRAPIGWRYLIVELVTGLTSLLLYIKYGWGYQYPVFFLFAALLLAVSFTDLEHQIIPDRLSLPGILVGWLAAWLPGPPFWLDSLIGGVAGAGGLFLVAFVYERITGREGMGGGDVKLLGMIGAWLGWQALPFVVLLSSLTGVLAGGTFLLLSGKGSRARIPFGPFLSLGALLYVFWGPQMTAWYYHALFGGLPLDRF